jgi:hypothetical protein
MYRVTKINSTKKFVSEIISALYLIEIFNINSTKKINKSLDFTENRGAKENMKNAMRT